MKRWKKILALTLIMVCLAFPVGITRGQIEPSLLERGANYEIWDNHDGTYTWRSAPLWIWNGTQYVPYIVKVTDENITVQAGLIGAEFHRGKLVYYDPNMTRLAVGRENWLVFRWDDLNGKWIPVCASLAKYFKSVSIYEGSEYLNITATWGTVAGNLTVIYHFEEHLKHTVLWQPSQAGEYAVVQFWNETVYDDVKLSNATVIKRTSDAVLGKADALTVLFFNSTQPFGIMEDQSRAEKLLHKVLFAGGTLNYRGISISDAIAWIFYNSTLSVLDAGETLRIDPATYTASPPSADAYVKESSPTTNYGTSTYLYVYGDNAGYDKRAFLKFDISRVPAGVTIISASLRVYCENVNFYVSGVSDIEVRNVTDDTWTETGITWSNQPSYGSLLDTVVPSSGTWLEWDVTSWVQNEYAGDQTVSVMLKVVNENYDGTSRGVDLFSKEYDSYDPQLSIVYNVPPTIGEFQAPSTVYANKYFYLNATINDADGVADLKNATVELSNGIILKWDNATDTFSEYQDSNNYCVLDTSNSLKTSVNSTAYKLSFKIKLSWNYTEGSINITSTNTKVFDGSGSSGSNSQTGIFTFEDDLIIANAQVSRNIVNPSESLTFTGYVYYQNTTISPEDTSGIIVYVELSGVNKGSTTIDSFGAWSISIKAESSPDTYNYTIYSYTDESSVLNATIKVSVQESEESAGAVGSSGTTSTSETLPLPSPETLTKTSPEKLRNYGIFAIVSLIGFAVLLSQRKKRKTWENAWRTRRFKNGKWKARRKEIKWKRKRKVAD